MFQTIFEAYNVLPFANISTNWRMRCSRVSAFFAVSILNKNEYRLDPVNVSKKALAFYLPYTISISYLICHHNQLTKQGK